jgi:small subunit ribosomal protein S20
MRCAAILGRRRTPAGLHNGRRSVLVANIRSQEKRIHRSERERLENRRRTSTVKTYFRRLERAVESKDESAIQSEYQALISKIDKAAEHGALHRNNAARKKARAARIRARSVQ